MTEKMFARCQKEKENGSTAETFTFSQKAIEALLREKAYKKMRATDYRARPAGKADIFIYGKRAEIKTGGTVLTGNAVTAWTENNLFSKEHYIVFPVINAIYDEDDMLDNTAIFDRDTFIQLCASCSRKGINGTFHVTGRPAVVAFQPLPLKKLRDLVMDLIVNGDALTFRTYLMEKDNAGD